MRETPPGLRVETTGFDEPGLSGPEVRARRSMLVPPTHAIEEEPGADMSPILSCASPSGNGGSPSLIRGPEPSFVPCPVTPKIEMSGIHGFFRKSLIEGHRLTRPPTRQPIRGEPRGDRL